MDITQRELETCLADALEHLYDYSYLGVHRLAQLRSVSRLIVHDRTPLTHVDRGRAVSKTLQIAIAELKPQDEPPTVGHETHFYAILHQEYCEGKENSAIALDLSISERTFYRDRARALRCLARIVWEMEQEAETAT